MLVLDLPRELIDSAVPAVERQLARRPDGWNGLAARGKVRRFSGDPAGLADLRRAADTYLEVLAARPDLLTAMNLHRLADSEATAPLLDRLRAERAAEVGQDGHDAVRTGGLIDACFLQGDDEQVQAAFTGLEVVDRSGLRGTRYPQVARLSGARVAGDVGACDEVVAWFDALVARERDTFYGTGGMNAYDWLEIALVTRSEVAGEVSSRLREL